MNHSPADACAPAQPAGVRVAPGHLITVGQADSEAAFICQPGQTVLFAGQAVGWDLPYECASGGCGTCRAQLLSGEIASLWPDAIGLTERNRRRGNRVLLCQSRPRSACVLRRPVPLRRLGEATPRPARHESRIIRMELLTPDMMALELECGEPVPYLAGQFAILEMPDGTRRPYSMSRVAGPAPGRLEMLIRSKPGGAASRWLFQDLCVGSHLLLEGPYGRAHAQSPPDRPVVCVAGGSGLGSALAIAEHCMNENPARPLSFYYGGRSIADLVLRDRFSRLSSRGASVIAVAQAAGPGAEQDRGWGPVRAGLVVDAVAADHHDLTGHDLYAAGPAGMIDALLATLVRTSKAAADRVFFDRFGT